MRHLRSICDEIEQVSIDECYMSFEPIQSQFPTPEAAAAYIKDSVYDTFGFTVNVGISDRKVLAKMASDFKKPNLVHTLYVSEIQKNSGHCQLVPYICVEKAVQNCCRKWESARLEIWRVRIKLW